jgi:hypothetical protein
LDTPKQEIAGAHALGGARKATRERATS